MEQFGFLSNLRSLAESGISDKEAFLNLPKCSA